MKTRSKIIRKIANPPLVSQFVPVSENANLPKDAPVILHLEEFESLRLCDYENMNHQRASEKMGVSRPTFTRIYASALKKIAVALVEGRKIFIEGGSVCFDSDWYVCNECESYFNHPEKHKPLEHCPVCASKNFTECNNSIPNNKKTMNQINNN